MHELTSNAHRTSVALLGAAALLSCTLIARADLLNQNLVINPGAELGDASDDGWLVAVVPGWTTTGNFTAVRYGPDWDYPSQTDPGPADRGNNFFSGGPENAASGASQNITVAALAGLIDSSSVSFALSAFLGGYLNQGDNAVLTATFLDSNGNALGSSDLGPVTNTDRQNATGLLFREVSGDLPVGTRSIDLALQMTRLDGVFNDGYADNLSLVLRSSTPTVPETGVGIFGFLAFAGLLGLHRAKVFRSLATTK